MEDLFLKGNICTRQWVVLTTGQSTKPSLPHRILAVLPQQPLFLPISHTVFHSSLSTGGSGSLWMVWSCQWARVYTKAVSCSSDIHGTNCTDAGSPSTHAVSCRDAPAFWGNKGAVGPALLQRHCAFRLLSKNCNNLLFQPLEFTKSPLASDLTDLSGTSVGLLLTQTWLCIINLNTFMNLPLNKYFKGSIQFHSVLLSSTAAFLFNFHVRCLT